MADDDDGRAAQSGLGRLFRNVRYDAGDRDLVGPCAVFNNGHGQCRIGAAFQEFVTGLYQGNRLARNQFEIGGRNVDLRALTLPVLNLIGSKDHLVPREASLALGRLIGSKDYTAMEFALGHIGMYVSARAQREVPASIARWLAER